MSAVNPLAIAIAAGIEAAHAMDEERIKQIVRDELEKWKPAQQGHGWVTPPAAARSRGISVKRVRALIAAGTVQSRAKVPGSDKTEINLASLDAALAGEAPQKQAEPINAAEWASRRAARKAAP